MPTLLTPISAACRSYTRIDPRLAALLELDDHVFEPADPVLSAAPPVSLGSGQEAARGWRPRERPVQRRSGPLAFLTGPRRWAGTFEPVRGGPAAPRGGQEAAQFAVVSVFVTATSAGALDAIAEKEEIVWRSRAGRVATADVRAAQLTSLEESDDVVAVEWTGGAKPTGAPERRRGVAARRAVGLDIGANEQGGAGVVVGVVDIEGIDIYHPDFVAAGGRPRVTAIWDQTATAEPDSPQGPPAPYGYGVAYSLTDVFMELDPNSRERYSIVRHSPLKVSHGTMVAGVVAGGGAGDPDMRGVAPGADIVFVSTRASGAGALAAMTEIAEAVDFVFRQAGERPCVVNVSLGDDLGPRDGLSPVERFFDEILAARPGRAIVVAAGNEHESGTHVSATVPGEGRAATIVVDARRSSQRHAVIEIWYDAVPGGREGIQVQIESPDGASATPVIAADGLARAFDLGDTRLLVTSVKRYPGNDDALIRVEMFPRASEGDMDVGEYKLYLTCDGGPRDCYAWLDHPRFKLRAGGSEAAAPAPVTLTSPATCRSAVTVGACHHETGQPARFNGRGPGRRGVAKPEVIACGVTLCAPSAATTDRYYSTFTGTSAAAPLVTGAIALAFEHAKKRGATLSVEETKAFVRAASEGCAPGGMPAPARGGAPGEAGRLWLPADGGLDEIFARAGICPAEADEGSMFEDVSMCSPEDREAPTRKERQTMSAQDTKSHRKDQDLVREKDGQQIGVGYFTLIQGGIQTGRLLVVPDGGLMVEHWDLWQAFRQPSWALTRQELTFEYVGEPIGVTEFTSAIGQNSTYIVARCQTVTL